MDPSKSPAERFYVPPQFVEIRPSPNRGLGIFASIDIAAGTTIEQSPILVFPTSDLYNPTGTAFIAQYVFTHDDDKVGLALGYGSIYNHSYDPNAAYEDLPGNVKRIFALRDITTGNEVTINYNGSPSDRSPVGFPVL